MVHLDLSFRKLTEICVVPNNVSELYFKNNQITKIENLRVASNGYPNNLLEKLHLDSNQILKIENLPDSLMDLCMDGNKITRIENLPNLVQILELGRNQITKIENLPNSLLELWLQYNNIIKIENLPNYIQILSLTDNQISKIENLPNLLQELHLGYNRIKKIECLPNTLQKLWLNDNKIKKIENLPNSLQMLLLSDNMITKIENLPNSLQILLLSNNQITKIENLPNLLRELYLCNNIITKIENLPDLLQELGLSSNKITELPLLLLEHKNINIIYYFSNPIEFIHPLVERWLRRLNRKVTSNNKVYSDSQNVHNSSIQISFRDSLENLLKDKNILPLDNCKKYVLECNELDEQTKRELLNYCDDETEHSVYLVKFEEVFQYVVSRIVRHTNAKEMFKILNEEIKDTICKCFTGRMTRLVNVLNGFYDDIIIQIGSNEQISNIILMLKECYEGKELVSQVRLAMEERDYDEDIIEEWLTYVE